MRHLLHLIRDPAAPLPVEIVAAQARDASLRLTVVLLGEAGALSGPLGGEVYQLSSGPADRSTPHPRITYARLVQLIFRADVVVTW